MITDVAGRIRNVQVPHTRPLLPLFEAINNSVQAIDDASRKDGRVEVEVIRDAQSLLGTAEVSSDRQLAEITGFVVTDNGIGFDDRNFEEFNKADTTYKVKRGGKGIGRFTWLVAFERAEIESVYASDGRAMCRRFTFSAQGSGIGKDSCEVTDGEKKTAVRLIDFKEPYRRQCPKRSETIAAHIVEEFLDIFLGPSPPVVTLRDGGQSIELNTFFEHEIEKAEQSRLTIKRKRFDILHVRLYFSHVADHRLCLCADGRVVLREKLTGIPNLARRLRDPDGREFAYAVYVNSQVLDRAVNADRSGFTLPEDANELLPDEITMKDIRVAVQEHCKRYLLPHTEPVRRDKRAKIDRFVEGDGAMYRPILKRIESSFDDIEPEATNEQIERQFDEAYHRLQAELRTEGQKLLGADIPGDSDLPRFEAQLDAYFEKVTEINRADLARYVCHRRAILEFLRQQLGRRSDGKYSLEERIHSIIFPRGKTSDEVLFEEHNLWLIDERLAFSVFLSSDRPIAVASPIRNESKKEPDILVFDKAVAFSDVPDVPFTAITIVEFKRPQRDDYTDDENPFSQVADYVQDIMDGKALRADGRAMPVPLNLPFYCYIICDFTSKLERLAQHFELEKTPDGLGFFGYKRALRAYFEVISYSKLLSDSEKRNQAFFQKLGLPRGTMRIPQAAVSKTKESGEDDSTGP